MSKELAKIETLEAEAAEAQRKYEKAFLEYDRLVREHQQLQADVPARSQELANVRAQIESCTAYITERRDWMRANAGNSIYSGNVGSVADGIASGETMKRELELALPSYEERLQLAHDSLASFTKAHPRLEAPKVPSETERALMLNAARKR